MRLACGTCSAVQLVSSPESHSENEGASSEAEARCLQCGAKLLASALASQTAARFSEQASAPPWPASEEEAIGLDHLSPESLALANQLSFEQVLPIDEVFLESEPWFELEKPFADVPLTPHAALPLKLEPAVDNLSPTDRDPSVELMLTTPATPAALEPSDLRSRAEEHASTELVAPASSFQSRADEPPASTRSTKRVPPPPPISRSPHSSSTQLPPTQFGYASDLRSHETASRARSSGSRSDIPRPHAEGARSSSQVGLTGSHAALSLETPEPDVSAPDVSAPRTRTGSQPIFARTPEGALRQVSLAPQPESAPADGQSPTIRPRPGTQPPPLRPALEKQASMLRQPAEPAPSPAGRVPPVAPPRSTLPGDRWYVLTPRGQVGPYKADEFASRLETGEVSWDMLIWRHGLRDWKAGRRDDLLVIAVAGTLGLGNKTTPLEGLSALMRSSSTAAESARAPDGAGEWRVDDDDTRLESWPLGMRLRPTLPPQSPSVQQGLPAQRSPQMLSSQRSLPPQPSLLQQRALPPQARPPSAQFSLSAQHVLPAQPPVSLQQALSTSVPGSPTQRVRVPGTRPPPPLTSRNTASQGNARETPTGRFPRSSANSPEIKRGGRATSIAILAFAAGAVVALSSGRIVDLSRVVLGEPPVEAASQQRESPAAGQLPAVFSRWFAEEPRAAKPPAPDPVEGSTSTDPSSVGKSADQPGSQTPALASSGNVEIVTRSLPAPEEVRDELKRLSATLSRCVRNPAAGLDVEFTVDGPTGGVGKLDVHAPELTPGRLECLKEGFSDLHVRPFVSSELKYRHRFAW